MAVMRLQDTCSKLMMPGLPHSASHPPRGPTIACINFLLLSESFGTDFAAVSDVGNLIYMAACQKAMLAFA